MCPGCWRTIPRKKRQEWRATYRLGAAKFLAKTRELLSHAGAAKSPLGPEVLP